MFLNILTGEIEDLETLIIKEPETEPSFVIAIPHPGLYVPQKSIVHLNLNNPAFKHDPDHGADQIYDLTELGALVVSSHVNRDVVDLNRDNIYDPKRGVIAQLGFNGSQLVKEPYTQEETSELLDTYYDPFHNSLRTTMDTIRDKRGKAFVLNGHTSASTTPTLDVNRGYIARPRPTFCIGTNGGTTAETHMLKTFEESLRDHAAVFKDSRVEVDTHFKGDIGITKRYGVPNQGYNSILLEVNRGQFFDEENKKVDEQRVSEVRGVVRATLADLSTYL